MINKETNIYFRSGEENANRISNHGSILYTKSKHLNYDFVDSYKKFGFYIFKGVINDDELSDLDNDLFKVLSHAPAYEGSNVDITGRKISNLDFLISPFRFAKPLSDPVGGTIINNGRHPVKMEEPQFNDSMPESIIYMIYGIMHLMASCLRLYGHPDLLKIAQFINGKDFTPFADSIQIKEPGLGTSTGWHQDGSTHWNNPEWHENIHGFNFITQLYPTMPSNALWAIPGSHKLGKIDIKQKIASNGNVRLPGAVPILCERGDVVIINRQILHGSFANTSSDRRVSIHFGFHRRDAVLNVKKFSYSGKPIKYDENRIFQISRIIQLGIDARSQRFPDETSFVYHPMIGQESLNRYNNSTYRSLLKNYNTNNLLL